MNPTHYAPEQLMVQARDRYFADNGFGSDGGYNDAFVDFKLGPLPFPFPNTQSRVRALRYHDLHHVLTGYQTDLRGEFEISAWELGAGCAGFGAAWVLNLAGMTSGAVVAPRRTWRAFLRGRRCDSLYRDAFEPLLAQTVASVRAQTRADRGGVSSGSAADRGLFAAGVLAGGGLIATLVPLVLALLPLGLFNVWRKHRHDAAQKTAQAH